MSAEPAAVPPPPDVERHGPLTRAALVGVGAVLALAGAALAAVLVFAISRGDASSDLGVMGMGAMVLAVFAAIAAYGAHLVRRGVRGWSRAPRPTARADRWLKRHAFASGLVAWGALALGDLWASGGADALLSGERRLPFAWSVFLFLAVIPLHVALHEVGHAVAGALVGFRFSSLRVGSVVVARDGGRLRWSWSPLSVSLIGLQHGVAVGDAAIGARAAFRIAGGPVTTLLAAAACRAGAAAAEPALTVASALAVDVLRAGWWAGAFLVAANLLPIRTSAGLVTDGARLLAAVLPTSPGAKAVLRASTLSAQGCRPGAWGVSAAALLDAATTSPRSRDALLVLALIVALDSGDATEADAILLRAAQAPPSDPIARHEIALQGAMVRALRGDAGAARGSLAGLGPHPIFPEYPKLAEAVVLLAEGDAAGARAALETWRRALAASGLETPLRVGNEWAEEALEARLAETAPPLRRARPE